MQFHFTKYNFFIFCTYGPYIYDVHMKGWEGGGVLRFVKYFQIVLFLYNRSFVYFCRLRQWKLIKLMIF